MANETKTIQRAEALNLLMQLFKERFWLLDEKAVFHPEPDTEQEAVSFLLALAQHKIEDWHGLNQASRETVSWLLMDFLTRLHSDCPAPHQAWQVSKRSSNQNKALEIIAAEIGRSHPHFLKTH